MQKEDFSIHGFNYDLNRAVANQSLDFCSLLVMALDTKLSVTAKYMPPMGEKRYVTLDRELNTVDAKNSSAFYYGASPLLDNSLIISAISSLCFTDLAGLDSFISDHCELFMLHADQADFLLDFARTIVLSVASNFAVRLRLTDEEAEHIRSSSAFHRTAMQWESGVLKLLGCPTAETLSLLSGFRFVRLSDGSWEMADDGIALEEIYRRQDSLSLASGTVFYSGVLIKPLRFEALSGNFASDQITAVCIHFERTTYATVFTLDHNFTDHPLLRGNNSKVIDMFHEDDRYKRRLISRLDELSKSDVSYAELLDAVNDYLDECFNVNQIGISANIVTQDDVLLMGRRSKSSIDGGYLYPGVNGNAEVADRNVSFYNASVYEDFPTIVLDSDRIDFAGEIGREAYAELKLDLPKQEWECYGITLSGNCPEKTILDESVYSPMHRRLHFNILFEQNCGVPFCDAEKGSHTATEAFENSRLLGVVVKCYKNRLHMLWDKLTGIAAAIAEQKDIVESLLVLLLFFSTLFIGGQAEDTTWYTIASLLLSLVIVFSTIKKVVYSVRTSILRRRSVRRITLYEHMPYKKKDDIILSAMSGYSYHPVAYAAVKLYVDNKAYDSFFVKDRRHGE